MEVVVFWFVFAGITAGIAHSRGRNVAGWFCIGFVIGIFGIILVLVMPNLNDAKKKEEEEQEKYRRLKEKMKKDKLMAEQAAKDLNKRVDAHDHALGISTAAPNLRLGQGQGQALAMIGSFKKCPQCAEEVKSEAKICRFCHYEFTATDSAMMNERGEPMKKCPQCAEEVRSEARVCRFCKHDFSAA